MRIGIDLRRPGGSGVGRVTQNIVEILLEKPYKYDVILFTGSTNVLTQANSVEIVECNIPYHSNQEYFEYPKIVDSKNLDLFIAPQYYISPNIACPTIKFIHDLWPLFHPKWIPSTTEFASRFGTASLKNSLDYLENFILSSNIYKLILKNAYLNHYFQNNFDNPIALYYAAMFFLAVHNSTLVFCPSEHTKAEIEKVFPEYIKKVRVIPNSFNPIFKTNEGAKENFILHVSNWEPRKNLQTLIAAFEVFKKTNPEFNLILAGHTGISNYVKYIQELVNNSSVASSISCLGYVEDRHLIKLYQKAKVYVCPSFYEGFGIPVIEAMVSGTPVICSESAALPEICGNAALYFNPHDPKSLLNQIELIISDNLLYKGLIEKGFSNVEKYHPTRVAKEIFSIVKGFQ